MTLYGVLICCGLVVLGGLTVWFLLTDDELPEDWP